MQGKNAVNPIGLTSILTQAKAKILPLKSGSNDSRLLKQRGGALMNEQEKKEFHRRKAEAEAQLHQIYYGSHPKSNGQGLKMPGFLSPAQSAHPKQSEPVAKKTPASPSPDTRPVSGKTNGMNLLNLLMTKH